MTAQKDIGSLQRTGNYRQCEELIAPDSIEYSFVCIADHRISEAHYFVREDILQRYLLVDIWNAVQVAVSVAIAAMLFTFIVWSLIT